MIHVPQPRDLLVRDASNIWEQEGLGLLASECGLLASENMAEYILSRVGRPPLSYPHPWSDGTSYQRSKRARSASTDNGRWVPPHSNPNFDNGDMWREPHDMNHNEPGLILTPADYIQPKVRSDDKTPLMFHDNQDSSSFHSSLPLPNLWKEHNVRSLPTNNYDAVFRGASDPSTHKMQPEMYMQSNPHIHTTGSRTTYPMSESYCAPNHYPVAHQNNGWPVHRASNEWDSVHGANGFPNKRRYDDAAVAQMHMSRGMTHTPNLDGLLGAAGHVGAYVSPTLGSRTLSGWEGNSSDSDVSCIAPQVSETRDSDDEINGAKARGGKQQKGLRYYSQKVCEKVEQQKTTTYNHVADELVRELTNHPVAQGKAFDEKNIRRRVYDAINVLVAIGVLIKDRKDIKWGGLPGGMSQKLRRREKEKEAIQLAIVKKRKKLEELLAFTVGYKNLIARNQHNAYKSSLTVSAYFNPSSVGPNDSSISQRVALPFVVIHTRAQDVDCSMSPDRTKVRFKFSEQFGVEHAQEVVTALGLSQVPAWELPNLIPHEMCDLYPREYIDGANIIRLR